ncbi:putative dynein heavy chain, cytosolic [Trypanosoma grayi]|uniref:putative dynein heavy chain, cytosolic n=1 Tax=Trypanosoma grayi TaxID=71804 RepID=UPI0004F40166|nr:putative dynein heavy chain, cytosolic [Trypanosoma grayi]KEG14468.1 putative dynein heavy chain, cytosolic [Trypanosoma grayi]
MVRCILLSRRGHSREVETEAAVPLTLRQLDLHAVDMREPLEGLQALLQCVYEPILRAQREATLWSQTQDLVSSIRSSYHVLTEVDLTQFVHAELLELCASYPAADVQELIELLGPEKSTDANFLYQVLSVRNMCRTVLDAKLDGKEIVNARDEVAYWQAVLRWVEHVQRQIQSREWLLVHRLLGQRVATNYEVEFRDHTQLVRDYLDHLRSVPFQQIDGVEEKNYTALVEELFTAMISPTRYPASQSIRLLESIVRELVERFVVLVVSHDVLRIDPPEAQLQCLRETIGVLHDLQQRYLQSLEFFRAEGYLPQPTQATQASGDDGGGSSSSKTRKGASKQAPHQYYSLILSRARQLWSFINEHFHYERALRRTFADGSLKATATCSFRTELAEAYNRFTTATTESGCLWDVTPVGTAEFLRALAAYESKLASIDERLALLVGTMLATAQEMSSNGSSAAVSAVATVVPGVGAEIGCGPSLYRIYSRFRPLRREKIQAVVAGFQMALLEQINREMKDVRERYFDAESCRDAVRLAVARFGVTPAVGRMMWEKSVRQEIEEYLLRCDAISEHGWHQLLHLRTIEHRWCLNEQLAQFLGLPLEDLVPQELAADSEVHGTAYALAYLEVVHAKDEQEWSLDPYIQAAQQFVQQYGPRSLGYAKSRLVLTRVSHGRGTERHEVRDVQNFCDTIAQRLQERVVQWCEDVRRRIAALDVFPDTLTMKGSVMQIIEVRDNNSSTSNSEARRTVMPHIPRGMSALLQDLHMLDSMRLLTNHSQLVSDVRSFFRYNEERFRTANCLTELIRTFEAALNGDDELMVHLATDDYVKVHQKLLDGAQLRWSDEGRVLQLAQELSERVYAFCAAATQVREVEAEMERGIAKLHSRQPHRAEAIVARVEEMCTLVAGLFLKCANTSWWVQRLQPRLDTAIGRQLEGHLRRWTDEFLSMGRDPRFLDKATETEEFHLKPLRVRMRVVYKEIGLSLSAAACRHHWVNELNRCFAWVHTMSTLLPEQQQQQEQQSTSMMSDISATATYDRLLECLDPQALTEPLQAIDKCIQDALEVEAQWKRGQQLLNIEMGILQQRLGDDLEKWGDALRQIRELASRQMDFTQPSTLIGGIIIVADDAQKELGRKLDSMTQYIHSRYRDVVEKHLESCYHRVMEERTVAENCNVINDLGDAARFLCNLPDIRAGMQETEKCLNLLVPAEEYLKRQGFALPESWVYVRKVKEEYRAYHDLIERKVKALEFRRPFLRESVKTQEDALRRQIDELDLSLQVIDTQQQRELHEELSDSAQTQFVALQKRAAQLQEQQQQLMVVQEALGVPQMVETKLEAVTTRMQELQWVCGHIAQAYQRLAALGRTPFFEMVPRQLHDDLLAVEREVEGFPEGVRSHKAYKELLSDIENRLACRRVMEELRSDAMTPLQRAERHWVALKSQVNVPWRLEELTVGDVWRSDPLANAKIYHDVLEFAQGERRMETQLGHIITFWNDFEFNTTVYQRQFVLIRGWDLVFERLSDDLDSFQGLRSSPFFTSQHVTAMVNDWDNRLNLLRQLLEVLMSLQRRWVHLDGIFTGNTDIRMQLPNDAIQFDRASREFMSLMPVKAGFGAPPVVKAQDFLEDKKLLPALERLEGQLARVQRALSTYLDMKRRQFPRFFFVGDDDLLETLGNSSNPALIEKHLPKMFAALARLIVNDEKSGNNGDGATAAAGTHVVGFASAEGEQVPMSRHIALKGRPLHEWLAEVEAGMVESLRQLTVSAVASLSSAKQVTTTWLTSYPLQVVCLAFQVWWVQLQEQAFATWKMQEKQQQQSKREPSAAVAHMVALLDRLASDATTTGATHALRHAIEELITLAVYQRDVSRVVESKRITSVEEFEWMRVLRLYLCNDGATLQCCMADAAFLHGFEYIGWYQRLVQTTLTDRCYLTMTQALHTRLGGSPVGPAGSGKTETVKALGTQLGRYVLVFNCDDAFDFDAVGRIFLGLCQVGSWGCFDEFNRLEERVLSAVSQQIQTIQEALRTQSGSVTLAQQTVPLRENVALFITMNPGFAGRSNLPGNLKQLFRTMTMAAPDRETIAEVMLFAQGFRTAESLSRKIVPLFHLCEEHLSRQAHYDFGLRALKSVLVTAGDLKRAAPLRSETTPEETATSVVAGSNVAELDDVECELVLRSLISSVTPRLVTEDVALFYPLLRDFFPGRELPGADMTALRAAIEEVCRASRYAATPAWVEKVCQLYHTRKMRHGLMLVGPSGTGKTACWKTLLRAMARLPVMDDSDNMDGGRNDGSGPLEAHAYIIDPKAMSKAELFGVFEATTREWKDGVFTEILRRIVNNAMGDDRAHQQHWIVFDGDVDPNWVENLNSLLDDNKVYTLPNGERLSLPPSVRIVFEVQDLRYATPATVSRCGMVWFSSGTVPIASLLSRQLGAFYRAPLIDRHGRKRLADVCGGLDDEGQQVRWGGNYFMVPRSGTDRGEAPLDAPMSGTGANAALESNASPLAGTLTSATHEDALADSLNATSKVASLRRANALTDVDREVLQLQVLMANVWAPAFAKDGMVERALRLIHSERYWKKGVMENNDLQLLRSVHSLLLDGIWQVWMLREEQESLPSTRILQSYAEKLLHYAVLWGFGASLSHDLRNHIVTDLDLAPPTTEAATEGLSLLDVEPNPARGTWCVIRERVQETVVRAEQVGANDTVIPTVDTCRHEAILHAWISGGNATILCGPPGSGKTMSITSILRRSAEHDAVFLNFSSGARPENVIRALEQYCTVQNTARGHVMSPTSGKRLLLFCDEINLPALDQYGTQPVVQLLRQLIERGGYYRSRDNAWITVEGVQVIGACNPPTDVGRVSLSHRFLRWAPVLLVDFPTEESLHIIYTAYCRAILAFNRQLQQSYAEKLAWAMVDMYAATQARFSSWQQPHYVYSPRDLSRWTRAIHEGLLTWDDAERRALRADGLVRLAVHEGLRVFQDRLVESDEEKWTDAAIDRCFTARFRDAVTLASALRRPLLYSTILHRAYSECTRDVLRTHIEHKLEAFCEEEVDAALVVYDAMVDHVTRIDRVLRQPMGHVLLAGSSGVGKTMVARLVAWMNGMTVFRLGVHRNYQLEDYERDLRDILRRAGCKLERICFIFDDSNIMEASFLEYMNALLASGEVPGLFDGEEWAKLMEEIRDSVQAQQLLNASSKPQKLAQQQQQQVSGLVSLNTNDNVNKNSTGGAAVAGSGGGDEGNRVPPQEALDTMASATYVDTTSEQDLYRWFLSNVKRNLHVVFTIDPSSGEFASRAVASPALFNRCTIDWFGDWDRGTRYQVTQQLTQHIDVMFSCGAIFQQRENEARDTLAYALCRIHEITDEVNRVVRLQNAHHGTFITPRHFADFVQQLQLLYEEKKGGSKEQLAHLRSGLGKLDDASEEVELQRAKLREHEVVLAANSKKAQLMLDRIVTDTETTKREKKAAEQLRVQLQEEEEIILADKARVQQQLSEAEPALREAEVALNTIKPEYLREIRAYTTPPMMVKRVLEMVLVVMGEKRADEWDVIKHHIRRDDFLAGVKAFQPRSVTEEARETVRVMLEDDGFTYEAARRASKAAGPLLLWAQAQTNYAAIFAAMEPLRTRIDQLAVEYNAKRAALTRTEAQIQAMEASLLQLKAEYQAMTEEMATIKSTMGGVAARCERATTLLQQLLDERGRWESEAMGYDTEVRTILGDCALAAASLAYFGYFDERTRQSLLFPRWRQCLQQLQLPVREGLRSVVEYLVTPQERLSWEQHGLPKDHLCVENAMILSRCQRYPLLIDPSGVAAEFLLRLHAKDKINKSSFSKPGYLKQLDMAVRFGYPILVQDAELIDPALSPLMNHETHRVGGHTLTRLGAQDVEMAAAFRLFLVTRDSYYQPSPGMAGQVCLVNFTVTPSSLQSQCRHRVLLHEHPELDARRSHILRVQGEYQLRLRVLEQELLTSIARSEGSLLENDALTVALERLKGETQALKGDIAESDASMQAIAAVEAQYQPLAAAVAKMYFALRRFSQLHALYHYNVDFIFRLIADALSALPPRPATATEAYDNSNVHEKDEERLQALTCHIFNLAHHRVRRGMFAQDHLVLAIVLGKLRSCIADSVGKQITPEEWSWFDDALQSPSGGGGGGDDAVRRLPAIVCESGVCVPSSEVALAALLQRPLFAVVRESLQNPQHASAWRAYFASTAPHTEVLPAFKADTANDDNDNSSSSRDVGLTRRAFLATFLLLHTRRDAFAPAVYELLRLFFDGAGGGEPSSSSRSKNEVGGSFFSADTHDLAAVQAELSDSTPLILVANAGSDPTLPLEALARAMDVSLRVAVMGSATGLDAAERYLADAMTDGSWVLLKNIHLARAYADAVEKRVHRERAEGRLHRNFRLVFSIEAAAATASATGSEEPSAQLPASLVEASVVLVYEPPPGMKSSLMQTIGALKPFSSHANQSANMQRVYLAAAWLHAVVMERLLYVPMGWSTRYEFNDTEFWRILQAVDRWMTAASSSSSSGGKKGMTGAKMIDRDRVPWPALQTIIGTTLYGGKISNEFDQILLDLLCSQLMRAAVFDDDQFFALTDDEETNTRLKCGSMVSLQDVQAWVRALPDAETPLWARLPASASRVMSAQYAVATVERLAAVRLIDEKDTEGLGEQKRHGNCDEIDRNDPVQSSAPRGVRDTWWVQKIQRFCSAWYGPLNVMSEKAKATVTPPLLAAATAEAGGEGAQTCSTPEPAVMAIERECAFALNRMREILDDMHALQEICAGVRNPAAIQRTIMDHLLKDQVPPSWARSYQTYPTAADQWMADFRSRASHAQLLHEAVRKTTFEGAWLSLGLLFWPGAFLTATKQQAARHQNRSLEQMELSLELLPEAAVREHAEHTSSKKSGVWHIVGLTLYSARVNDSGGSRKCELLPTASAAPATAVGALLRWEVTAEPVAGDVSTLVSKSSLLMRLASQDPVSARRLTPFYVNPRREAMLEVVELTVDPAKAPMRAWYERSVCLVAWSLAEC